MHADQRKAIGLANVLKAISALILVTFVITILGVGRSSDDGAKTVSSVNTGAQTATTPEEPRDKYREIADKGAKGAAEFYRAYDAMSEVPTGEYTRAGWREERGALCYRGQTYYDTLLITTCARNTGELWFVEIAPFHTRDLTSDEAMRTFHDVLTVMDDTVTPYAFDTIWSDIVSKCSTRDKDNHMSGETEKAAYAFQSYDYGNAMHDDYNISVRRKLRRSLK